MSSSPNPPAAAPFLSIVIPAYNEELRLQSTIEAVEGWAAQQEFSWELVVVDDGSRDRTIEVARASFRRPESRVVSNPRNMGKGATIRNGMTNHARGQWRLFTDADNSTPIEEVGKLLERARSGNYSIAIGSRALADSRLEVRQPIYREMMGRVFNLFVRALVLPGIRDTQCGFKLFTAEAADYVFRHQQLDGFSFDVEILALAHARGFRITEVPVRWIDSPASRVSPIRDSIHMFMDLLRIRWRLRSLRKEGV